MKRWDVINLYIEKYQYKDYLEIGSESGMCRDNILAENKVTVDPCKTANNPTYRLPSDDFFEVNLKREKPNTYDVIFIDGLHHADQVLRDIENSLMILNKGGTIFCHDMLPNSEEVQAVPRKTAIWTGDCWKAWAKLKGTRKDLSMFIVEDDWGVGVIRKGKQKIKPHLDVKLSDMDWRFFCDNKGELNYITKEELAGRLEKN